MTLSSILKQDKFCFPLKRATDQRFKDYLLHLIEDYMTDIRSSPDLLSGLDLDKFPYKSHAAYVGALEQLAGVITQVMNWYFQGKTSKAYFVMSLFLESSGFMNIFKKVTFKQYTPFYRIRNKESNYPLDIHELFHIPFDKLEKVSTQRYSIPGYPALYLGNSLYVCWEELGRPDYKNIQCAILRNTANITIIDLDWTSYWAENESGTITNNDLLSFGLLWPLFAGSNIKVPDAFQQDPFKAEYIIPQFILQFLKDEGIIGLRYPSSKAVYSASFPENRHFNVVFPVDNITTDKYCTVLKDLFLISDVETWNMQNFMATSHKIALATGTVYDNPELKAVCLNNDRFTPYNHTSFWEVEAFLDSIKNIDLKKI